MKLANLTSTYRAKLIIKAYKNWIKPKQKALDIGCGTGVIAYEIAKQFELSIVGCDIDKYLLRDIVFKKMKSISKLPFSKSEFDIAFLNDVLHHTEYDNQKKLLKEAMRVASKVLIFELNPTVPGKISDLLINKIHNPKMSIPYTYRSVESWQRLFTNANFDHEYKKIHKPIFYPFNHVAFKLSVE